MSSDRPDFDKVLGFDAQANFEQMAAGIAEVAPSCSVWFRELVASGVPPQYAAVIVGTWISTVGGTASDGQ